MTQPKLTPAQKSAAITRAGKNTALLSGAGCGKTFVLARRFTELLMLHPDAADPQTQADAMGRFVALTFTDKAAMEMAQRVRSQLRDLASRAGSPADRRILQGWLDAATEARISTIHSFCAAVLRSCAVEAGLDPAFTVCAETAATDRMLAEATEEAILAALQTDPAAVAPLLGEMSFDRLAQLVRQLVHQRTHCDLHAYADPSQTLARWQELLQAERQAAQQRLRNDMTLGQLVKTFETFNCSDTSDKLYPAVAAAQAGLRTILTQPIAQCCEAFAAILASSTPGNVGSKSAWPVPPKEIRDTLKLLAVACQAYAPLAEGFVELDEQAAQTLAMLTKLAASANELYRLAKRSKSLLDFDDLILYTRDVLRSNEPLRKRLAAGVDQLLIDEAQDTDATQLGLLLSLLDASPDAPPAEGKLFLVGDAKQSIYRFRGAQVEFFDNVCEKLGSSHRVDLDISFRTHKAGTSFVNEVFQPLMGDAYTPIQSSRTISPNQPSVEILLAQPPENEGFADTEAASAAQAALTAQRIAEMLDNKEKLVWDAATKSYRAVEASDIAILFSRMTKSLLFERELQKRNLPYYVVAGSGFFHQQEIYDALNALRAIDNPFDDLAVIGVLRSAMFSLSDDTLLHLAQTHKPPYLPTLNPAALAGVVPDDQLESLRFAKDLLTRLAVQKDALGVAELLQRVLDETGYEAILLAQSHGRRMAGNLKLLLDQARSAAGFMSLWEFLADVDEQILSESRFEQASVAGEEENVIRLMTIHKAKGLEFPVVFVPDLNRARRAPTDAVLARLDWGLTTKLTAISPADEDDDAPLPLAHRLAMIAEARDHAQETIRNYYVALTRHEDHLVLIGADDRYTDGRFKDKSSFLAQLDDVLHLREALAQNQSLLPYASGAYSAQLRCETPKSVQNTSAAEQPAAGTTTNKSSAVPPLLGVLPESLGEAEVAVTALSDFEHCPASFHWRYELQCKECVVRSAKCEERSTKIEVRSAEIEMHESEAALRTTHSALSPALLGTLLHRCLELFSFHQPQQAEALVAQVLAERDDLPPTNAADLSAQLETMLAQFRKQSIATDIAGATETYRELDFLLRVGRCTLRGQIDLLFRDASGAWRIVDYKSDRVETPADMDAKLEHYELQLLVYSLAVAKFAGSPPADASLYFLRTGDIRSIHLTPDILTAAEQRIESLATKLIAARRNNHFEPCGRDDCYFCKTHP